MAGGLLRSEVVKSRSFVLIAWFVLTALLGAGVAIFLEHEKAESTIHRALVAWEEDLARDSLANGGGELSRKIREQLLEVHPALRSLGSETCSFGSDHRILLYGTPVTSLRACFDPGRMAVAGLLSPAFMAFLGLFGAVGLFFFRRQRRLEDQRRFAEEQAKLQKEKADLARRVAHDIRGPLSALKAVLRSNAAAGEDGRRLLAEASRRIEGIAEDLLERSRETAAVPVGLCFPAGVIERLAAELRLRFPEHVVILDSQLRGTEAVGLSTDVLQRIVSNLAQNAIEASALGATVTLFLRATGDQLSVIVADEGRGIPRELLEKLGREELTFGKENGNGIALVQARRWVEGVGGRFAIRSRQGQGTQVEIALPRLFGAAVTETTASRSHLQ